MSKTYINGNVIEIDKTFYELKLLDYLREELNLTGAKNGCEIGVCGACTIIVDDVAVRSCLKKVKDIIGHKVMTIEGLKGESGNLHPIQQAFVDCGAIQCGFCTPGMVLSTYALLVSNPNPTIDEIKQALKGNLCRCTGYKQIIDAVLYAKDIMNKKVNK